jgi:hypothetical protein
MLPTDDVHIVMDPLIRVSFWGKLWFEIEEAEIEEFWYIMFTGRIP